MTENVGIDYTEEKTEPSQPKVTVKKKKRKSASLEKKKARAGWIFVLPFVLGFVMIYLPIIYQSLRTSLVVRESGVDRFYGWQIYYEAIFASVSGQDFLRVLFSGVADMALDIPMILLFSLFMAILLNQKMAGRAAFRAIFFVPVILSTGIMESIDAGAIDSYMSSTEGINTGEKEDAATQIVSVLDVEKLFSGMSNTIGGGMLTYVTAIKSEKSNIMGISSAISATPEKRTLKKS